MRVHNENIIKYVLLLYLIAIFTIAVGAIFIFRWQYILSEICLEYIERVAVLCIYIYTCYGNSKSSDKLFLFSSQNTNFRNIFIQWSVKKTQTEGMGNKVQKQKENKPMAHFDNQQGYQ